MTDPDRSSFANLILLCTAHHKLIDRIAPDDHPVELLEAWKRESEAGEGLEDLSEMDGTLTDQRLADLIERAVSRIGATREVRVELEAGILHGGGQALTSTFEAVRELLRINEHIRDSRRLVVTTIRNVGFADATVESVTLNYSFRLKGSADLPESTLGLLGRNDFLLLNPELPHRLPSGDSMHWLTDLASLSWVEERGQDGDFTAVRASIQLGSGERVESNSVPWGELPF